MLIKLKSAMLVLICVVVVAQLAGCVYDRHGRRPGEGRQKYHDRDHTDIDVRIH